MLPAGVSAGLVRQVQVHAVRALSTSAACQSHEKPMKPNPYPTKFSKATKYSQVMPPDEGFIDMYYPQLGNRDIVGFGINGQITYEELVDRPYPAVRFKENTADIIALREKAKGDWKLLSVDEKKQLYRADFCQTMAEMSAPTGEWRSVLSGCLLAASITGLIICYIHTFVYGPKPRSVAKDWQTAQIENLVRLREGRVTGVSALWDYEKNKWKD